MAETFNHTCIKPSCGAQYQDTDPDPYYCEEHQKANKHIIKEIYAKFSKIPRKPVKSDLQIYDELCQTKGTQFPNIRDLGIKL